MAYIYIHILYIYIFLFWHSIWHSFPHILWHSFWHCIWHLVPHSFWWHSLTWALPTSTASATAQWAVALAVRQWGPARPTDIWSSRSGSAHWDPAAEIWSSRCHSHLELAVGDRLGGWGPAVPTEIELAVEVSAHWDLELAVEVCSANWVRSGACNLIRLCTFWDLELAGEEGWKSNSDKFRDLGLAGGEQKTWIHDLGVGKTVYPPPKWQFSSAPDDAGYLIFRQTVYYYFPLLYWGAWKVFI